MQANNGCGNDVKSFENWARCRQRLLTLYNHLCIINPKSCNETTSEMLNDFCEILEAYSSTKNQQLLLNFCTASNSHEVSANFKATKLKIKYFCKKYANNQNYDHLNNDLSWLGNEIATHLELEDSLLQSRNSKLA